MSQDLEQQQQTQQQEPQPQEQQAQPQAQQEPQAQQQEPQRQEQPQEQPQRQTQQQQQEQTRARNRRKSDHDEKVRGIRIRLLNAIIIVLAVLVSIMFLQAAQATRAAYENLESATSTYIACEDAANDMVTASSHLTNMARAFVVTRDESYLKRYFDEVYISDRRGKAISDLQENLGSTSAQADLESALSHSTMLGSREMYAMKLAAIAAGIQLEGKYEELDAIQISDADMALSSDQQAYRSVSLMFDSDYDHYLNLIAADVENSKQHLQAEVADVQSAGEEQLGSLLFAQRALTFALLLVIVLMIAVYVFFVLRPLNQYSTYISRNGELPLRGAYELRYLAHAYNVVFEENQIIHEQLLNRAERDHLTGLYNRSVFERTIANHAGEPIALLLIDADYFKNINDTLGHDGGDAMLQKIASLLGGTFRMTDYPCRIGGDEFAVIMTDIGPELKQVVIDRIEKVRAGLANTDDGLPVMTLSVGVAFSDGALDSDQLYKNADKALYKVKENGRNGYGFFE